MYIYIHNIHTYVHTYIHARESVARALTPEAYIHTYVYTYIRIHTYVYTYIRLYIQTRVARALTPEVGASGGLASGVRCVSSVCV